MKKKLVGVLLSAAMVVSSLAACGGSTEEPAADNTQTEEPAADTEEEAPADTNDVVAAATMEAPDVSGWDASKEIYAYSWNGESNQWLSYIIGPTDADGNKIVADGQEEYAEAAPHKELAPFVHCINLGVSGTDGEYQKLVDTAFTSDKYPSIIPCDDTVALYYIQDDDKTLDLHSVGLTDEMYANAYQYTKDYANWNGQLKGVTPQATPGNFTYRASIAKEVLGSDDPADVQAAVADWDKYNETAKKAADAGYTMCSVNDTYRTYANNVSGQWVQDGKLVIDANVDKWVDDSMALIEAGAEDTDDLWSDDWAKGKRPEGKVFCYFGPAWFFNFCLDADQDGTIANQGGWGYCEGPQSYYWGGTWVCAATGTDNANLVKDIIVTMTTDKGVLKDIATTYADCVNSKEVLAELASSDEGNLDLLGGQNPYEQLAAGAETVDLSNLSKYDQGCTEEFQKAMKNYFTGNATKDEALDMFKTAVHEKYPDVSVD
jgi:hypothetical protein